MEHELRIIAEGRMTTVDSRLHVGGVALSDLLDHLPSRYVAPAKADYGHARITVDVLESQPEMVPEMVGAAPRVTLESRRVLEEGEVA